METTSDCGTGPYLTFTLDREVYALAVSRVRGVLDAAAVNRVFDGSECVRGVVNLGGDVAPVVDLRPRLAGRRAGGAADTCVVVAELHAGGETTVLGFLAGGACEVLSLRPFEPGPCPPGGRPLQVLDPDRLFSAEELADIRASYSYQRAPGPWAGYDLAARRRQGEKRLTELHRSYERLPTTSAASALLDAVRATLAGCAHAIRREGSAAPDPPGEETHRGDIDLDSHPPATKEKRP